MSYFVLSSLFVYYLNVSLSRLITSVEEDRATRNFDVSEFPLPLGAEERLRYFILALPEPSL